MTQTERDIEKAWTIVEMCARMPDGNIRMHIAHEIANLLAEIRKLKRQEKK